MGLTWQAEKAEPAGPEIWLTRLQPPDPGGGSFHGDGKLHGIGHEIGDGLRQNTPWDALKRLLASVSVRVTPAVGIEPTTD